MTDKKWGDIFTEAKNLGISFIVRAGGEPLLREGVIKAAAATGGVMFTVYTNGVFF